MSHIFQYNDRDISYIYGGVNSFGIIGGHFGGKNAPLVLETDEAFNTFKNIEIQNLLVTNIDDDHLDFYGNYQRLLDAFTHVIKNTKNNVPLSKKKNIAKKWCKNQKYRGSPPGRCSIQQNLCKCEDDGSQEPINSRFKWKFGYKSIKSKKINYKKMKV